MSAKRDSCLAAALFDLLDRTGAEIERHIDDIERKAARRTLGTALLGVAVALSVVLGGLGAFIALFVVLVTLLH